MLIPSNIYIALDFTNVTPFSVTIFHFPRRVSKTSSEDVFKRSSRRLQDVFARCLQHVFKRTSCNYVLKTSLRLLEDVLEDKKVLQASSSRLHQDESLLGVNHKNNLPYRQHTIYKCFYLLKEIKIMYF